MSIYSTTTWTHGSDDAERKLFAEDASRIEIATRLALTRVFAAPNLFDQSSISDSLDLWREQLGLALRRAANAGRREV